MTEAEENEMMSAFCWNDREHEDKAREDARYRRPDYEMYDRYTSDPCKEVYTEAYDRERRNIERREEEREEERIAEERAERSRAERLDEERQYEAQYLEQMERAYYGQQQPEPEPPAP